MFYLCYPNIHLHQLLPGQEYIGSLKIREVLLLIYEYLEAQIEF